MLVGETGINAALCGTGAVRCCSSRATRPRAARARELLGDGLTTVAVKQGLGANAARLLPPVRARELIEEGARQALADLAAVPAYDPGSPCEIRVEFKRTIAADKLRYRAGVERVDGRTISPGRHVVGRLEAVLLLDAPTGAGSTIPSSSTSVKNACANGTSPCVLAARTSQSICSRSERASSSTLAKSGACSLSDSSFVAITSSSEATSDRLRHHLELLGAGEVLVADGPPEGWKIRSIRMSPSQAFSSQPSGGRSGRRPASTSAASARSASSSRTKKSTSCSVGGPPRAQAASPPPSRYWIVGVAQHGGRVLHRVDQLGEVVRRGVGHRRRVYPRRRL